MVRHSILLCGALGTVVVAETGYAQEQGSLDLGTLVLEGERIGRTQAEASPAITSLDPEDIASPRNNNLQDAIESLPNIVYEEGPYLPSIRGIDGTAGVEGSTSQTAGAQPRVPIIVDNVATPVPLSATTATTGLWDVEAVEVARGPQATTSGRNAIGGAVRVFTNDPTFETDYALRFGAFNQDGTATAAAMYNTVLVEDQVALRFAIEGSEGEAFVDVLTPGQAPFADLIERESFLNTRVKLLVEPDSLPGLSMVFGVSHQDIATTYDPGLVDRNGTGNVIATAVAGFKVPIRTEQTTYSVRASYEFSPDLTLEQHLSYLNQELDTPGGFRSLLDQQITQFVSDTTLKFSNVGVIDRGFVGFSYTVQDDDIVDRGAALPFTVDGQIENIGVFGEVEIGVGPATTLILGGRYEMDDRRRAFSAPVLAFAQTSNTSEDVFLPKIGIRHEVSDTTTIGYTYSEGFRAGGIDFNIFGGAPFFVPGPPAALFESERLRQHEIYVSGQSLDGVWSYSVTAFYYRFEDAQVLGGNPAAPFLIGNVPESEGYGLELSGSYNFARGFYASAGVGLLETEITDGGLSGFTGADLPRAPNFTANARVGYRSPQGLNVYADFRHVGSQVYRLGVPKLGAYSVVDLGLGYEKVLRSGRTVELDAYVKNLFDERYVTRDFDGGALFDTVSIGRPQTIGASITLRY